MSQIAVFTSGNRGFCINSDKITFSKKYSGYVYKAAKEFAKKVPPHTVCATYIERGDYSDVSTLNRLLSAFKFAGYKNINTYSSACFHTSTALNMVNLKCDQGDYIGMIHALDDMPDEGHIVEKTAKGYKFVDMDVDVRDFPGVKQVIIRIDELDRLEYAETALSCQEFFAGKNIKLHFLDFCYQENNYLAKFIWNKYHGGNLNGNLVAEVVGVKIRFESVNQRVFLNLEVAPLPYSKEFLFDLGESDGLRIFANESEIYDKIHDACKSTTVKITVSMGVDQLLDVKVKMIKCVPRHQIAPVRPTAKRNNVAIRTYLCARSKVLSFASCTMKLNKTNYFYNNNTERMVKTLLDSYPPNKVEIVLDRCDSLVGIPRLEECWSLLQKAGYTNIKPFDSEVFTCSVALHQYKVDIGEGETVALLNHETDTILIRHGRKFRRLHVSLCKDRDRSELLKQYNVQTVIADASYGHKPDITNLLDYKLIVGDVSLLGEITNHASCLWSIADGTDFDGYMVEESQSVIFKVCWNEETELLKTGLVPLPYEWTVELDVEKALTLQVFAALVVSGLETIDHSAVKSFDIAKIGSGTVSLTFCIDNVYQITTNCAALPSGHSPRPLSLCLLIERTAKGFRKTVYFRDSGKTIVTDCPNLFVVFDTFEQAEYAAVIFNATASTMLEREEWLLEAKKYGFIDVQFVNNPILKLNSLLFGVDRDNFIHGKTVLVSDMTAVDKNGQKMTMTYVLQCRQKKLKLLEILQTKVEKVYKSLDNVSHVFAAVAELSGPPKLSQSLNPVFLQHSELNISNYLFARIDKDIDPIVNDITGATFVADWASGKQVIDVRFESVPFSRNVALHVGEDMHIKLDTTYLNSKNRNLLKEFTFETLFDRIVLLNIAVDTLLVPSVDIVRSDPFPTTIIEFTADNRVIVDSFAIDRQHYPAYVSFGADIVVGDIALLRFQENPETVVYDVHRFFDPYFDPTHPDPSWTFKTSLGTSDETVIRIGESETTSTVAFGTIVNAVKLDIENRSNYELTDIGIRMPRGILVPEAVCSVIGNMLNIKLIAMAEFTI